MTTRAEIELAVEKLEQKYRELNDLHVKLSRLIRT